MARLFNLLLNRRPVQLQMNVEPLQLRFLFLFDGNTILIGPRVLANLSDLPTDSLPARPPPLFRYHYVPVHFAVLRDSAAGWGRCACFSFACCPIFSILFIICNAAGGDGCACCCRICCSFFIICGWRAHSICFSGGAPYNSG